MSCIDLFYYNPVDKDDFVNRNAEQQRVIKYFKPAGGCIGWIMNKMKGMTDDDYKELVAKKLQSIDFKQKALAKLGLDESQVQEIEPIHFEGYYFDKCFSSKWIKKDRGYVSSAYEITWIFFGDHQIYIYQYILNLDRDEKKERTEEYFYKDITNFSTTTETVEQEVLWEVGGCLKGDTYLVKNVDFNRFQISVMGDKFYCNMENNDYTESAVQGMKAKLREKKQA